MSRIDVDAVCVVIGRTRHKMVQMEIQEAARRGARLIEVRLDFLKKAPDFKRLLENKPCPLLATVRRPEDGGHWAGSEDGRRMLLRQAIVAGFDWVDLETDVADYIPRFSKVKRIVSYHNMRETPADLEKIHQRMCAQDADVIKVAVRAQHPTDNLRVLKLLEKPAKPTVAHCMGDLGIPSRLLSLKYGAPFTYAAFNKERNLAPGLPSFAELKQIYDYPHINAATQVFGILGDPVAHSLSPLVHNIAFRKLGINALYLPFRVPRADLPGTLRAFNSVPVLGYSVTIPHKEAVVELAAHHDPAVAQIKAANTLLQGEDGFTADNTDYRAVIDTLKENLAAAARVSQPGELSSAAPAPPLEPATIHSRVVLVLGAGGVARAVAFALKHEGALVTLCNRTPERAKQLAEEVNCRHVEWQGRHSVLCDVLINCTSVGMHPNVDEMPVHASYLKPGLTVFDAVYTPETTLLVKEARQRGCHVITGVDFFVRQAALQFQLFTGRPAPLELMRKVVRQAISPVTVRTEEE